LTGETGGLIGEAEFHMMKPSAFLINCARGPVVNEGALFRALKEGIIAGAGLDVFDPEPPKDDNPLFGLTNVVLSPHTAGLTAECAMRMASQAAQAIMDVLEGRRPEGVVNPDVFQ
jgi:D-3-phosphoglycerate dehydrogenase